ncbi:hypothetical protein GGR53DRAFT_527443 [Hypoxylon sp. FL1150]|nr:hypothetical protein GGR53DRAFT_527443 [Hypoxylon sp. FL1150]
MATISSYRPEAYDSLPDLETTRKRLRAKGTFVLYPVSRSIFLKHGVHESVGLVLLYKGFDIKPSQRLVEIRPGAESVWETGSDCSPVLNLADGHNGPRSFRHNGENFFPPGCDPLLGLNKGYIAPRSLRFDGKNLVPYDFRYLDDEQTPTTSLSPEFVEELSTYLIHAGLDQVVGLRILESRKTEVPHDVVVAIKDIKLSPRLEGTPRFPPPWIFRLPEECECDSNDDNPSCDYPGCQR